MKYSELKDNDVFRVPEWEDRTGTGIYQLMPLNVSIWRIPVDIKVLAWDEDIGKKSYKELFDLPRMELEVELLRRNKFEELINSHKLHSTASCFPAWDGTYEVTGKNGVSRVVKIG